MSDANPKDYMSKWKREEKQKPTNPQYLKGYNAIDWKNHGGDQGKQRS